MNAATSKVYVALSMADLNPKKSGDGYTAKCPAHEDRVASLSFTDGDKDNVVMKCFAGCSVDAIIGALGMDLSDLFDPSTKKKKKTKSHVVDKYVYTDENGEVLSRVVRMSDKSFPCYRYENGEWFAGMKDTRCVLYKLPELIEAVAAGRLVFLVEGEKDVHTLNANDLTATTAPGGASRWKKEYSSFFAGADVAIIPDNDPAGVEYGRSAANSLIGVARRIRVIVLPGVKQKGDVTDWLNMGKSVEELMALVEEAPEWTGITTPDDAVNTQAQAQPKATAPLASDFGNAERFVARFKTDIRYVFSWDDWVIWDGKRWRVDKTDEVIRRSKLVTRAMVAEANGDKELLRWALKSETTAKVASMLSFAKAEEGVGLLPDELDADQWAINVNNGTIDLKTGTLMPHARESLCSKLAPVTYDPQALCPKWDAFLLDIMGKDAEMVSFLQRAIGYSLTAATHEQCIFVLHGLGSNGKTTLLEVLRKMLGEYAAQAEPKTFQEKKQETISNDLAGLKGARFVTASETEAGGRLAESLVKQMTGGEPLTVRFLHKEFFTYSPEFKMFLATNHKPVIRGADNAIWRRIKLIPFEVTFGDAGKVTADGRLKYKLFDELPGIMAWAVRGCLAWQEKGLAAPESVKKATGEYRREMDILGTFVAEECVTGDPTYKVSSEKLYQSYVNYCSRNSDETVPRRKFGMFLGERGPKNKQGSDGRIVWSGIRLKTDGEKRDAFLAAAKESRAEEQPEQRKGHSEFIGPECDSCGGRRYRKSSSDKDLCVGCWGNPPLFATPGM